MRWGGDSCKSPPAPGYLASSDGPQGYTSGHLDRFIELVADDAHLAVVADGDGMRRSAHLHSLGVRRLLVPQGATQGVDEVQQRRGPDLLRVALKLRQGVLVQLAELAHHLDHGQDIGIVVGSLLKLLDGELGVDLDVHARSPVEQHGDDSEEHDNSGEQDVDDHGSSPFQVRLWRTSSYQVVRKSL